MRKPNQTKPAVQLVAKPASTLQTSKILFSPCQTRNPGNKLANHSEAAKTVPKILPTHTHRYSTGLSHKYCTSLASPRTKLFSHLPVMTIASIANKTRHVFSANWIAKAFLYYET